MIFRKAIQTIIPKYLLRKIRLLFYYGNKKHCPCCGGSFRKFLPYGLLDRENAKCPNCGSLERHRLIWLYLKDRTNLFSNNLMVLHFAPEMIFQKNLKNSANLDYISADLDPSRAMLRVDITNIYFKDNTFDVILCSHVLEHIQDDRKAMSELFRIIKPGGWSIIQVPRKREKTFEDDSIKSPEERERQFGQRDHVRRYGRDFKNRLEDAGFKVRVDGYAKELSRELFEKYGLVDIDIYFCRKS